MRDAYYLTGTAFFVAVIVGGIWGYHRWSQSKTADAIERNVPTLLDKAAAIEGQSVERYGAAGSFIGGLIN